MIVMMPVIIMCMRLAAVADWDESSTLAATTGVVGVRIASTD